MQRAEVCMFCYYRNKRLAACGHVDSRPDAGQDASRDAGATAQSATATAHARPAPATQAPPQRI